MGAWLLLACGGLVLGDVAFVWWTGDGLEGLEGWERGAAEDALAEWLAICLDNPLHQILLRHLHVVSVWPAVGYYDPPPFEPPPPEPLGLFGYGAQLMPERSPQDEYAIMIRAYTVRL